MDLVYLDPPFNSAQTYNAFFQEKDGTVAASAGFYSHKLDGQQYPCLQLRTVKELLEGQGLERPSTVAAVDDPFKKAPKAKTKGHQQAGLGI